jgi:hypothetical protein
VSQGSSKIHLAMPLTSMFEAAAQVAPRTDLTIYVCRLVHQRPQQQKACKAYRHASTSCVTRKDQQQQA